MRRARSVGMMLLIAGAFSVSALAHAGAETTEEAAEPTLRGLPLERVEDPPGVPAKATPSAGIASTITFGRFTSIQVNVNGAGANIAGDAANEPSLAVDATNHDRMVIGWRQFDTITSNFRQAGFGYTLNGGTTWTTGKIQPGVFRSDPVLDVDGSGHFFYNSLSTSGGFRTAIFGSFDGATWGPAVFGYGGDKQWMTIDRDLDNHYQAWSTASNSYAPNTFNKSIDDGDSFSPPMSIPNSPVWGTLDVASDHKLYVVGWGIDDNICVSRSVFAQNPDWDPPQFTTVPVDLGGFPSTGGPNPAGLLGQLWIAVDRSNGPHAGWVYVLASVVTSTDPVDVHFIRSTDNGQTWSAPVRVNDDPVGNRAFQWFGTMSVSPSGRIDAVWNDTRGTPDSTQSALYYSYSTNGGVTWSPNEQATSTWSSTVGWPNQQKIGDYYDMTSDDTGADLAYAATFNGGEDVYYLRIPNAPSVAVAGVQADEARLLENLPNPFATSTTIRFDAPSDGARVRLEVFDVGGHRVATLVNRFVAGRGQSVSWDGRLESGSPAPPGVYFCRLVAGSHTETRKLMRLW